MSASCEGKASRRVELSWLIAADQSGAGTASSKQYTALSKLYSPSAMLEAMRCGPLYSWNHGLHSFRRH